MATIFAPEYYQLAFRRLHASHDLLFGRNLIDKPLQIRLKAINKHLGLYRTLKPEDAHKNLSLVLLDLDKQFNRVLEKHSCFYWMHLYRRIGMFLSDRHGGNTGPMTLLWVRNIAEQAMLKYGRLNGINDIQVAKEVAVKDILGGYFIKSLRSWTLEGLSRDDYVSNIANSYQWVMTNFGVADLAAIYFIEGLSYQYWYITAKLRAAGKGISIEVLANGELKEARSRDQEFLIESYDERIGSYEEGLPSNVGTYVRPSAPTLGTVLVFASQNVEGRSIQDITGIDALDSENGMPFVPNYYLSYLDVTKYYRSHKYLESSFRKKHNFGLKEFCVSAYAISKVILSFGALESEDEDVNRVTNLHEKLQRGYLAPGISRPYLKARVLAIVAEGVDNIFDNHSVDTEIDQIIDFLTFNQAKKSLIGLWSLGPKYVLIPYRELFLLDMCGWAQIFRNLFFGLKDYDPKGKKGPEFEYSFAEFARENGLQVVYESKEIELGGIAREVDVAVRVKQNLYVCECRAQQRPLDFEIGNPVTIERRCADLDDKTDQVISLTKLFELHRRGNNYDVSWAQNIVPIVVSPYVEWIWSTDDKYWISQSPAIPRIMSASEAIKYLKGINQ